MDSSSKETNALLEELDAVAGGDLQALATRLYVSRLPEDLRISVHCGVILRWFDRDVLETILKSKAIADVGCSMGVEASATAYDRLQQLTFVEPYPGRGHTFHELTRRSLRKHLWDAEREFYHAVSRAAFDCFGDKMIQQDNAVRAGEIHSDEVDKSLLVERVYHGMIIHGADGLPELQDVMAQLYDDQLMGTYHDLIVALDDHIVGDRLEKNFSAHTTLWKAHEAFANWDADLVRRFALPLADAAAPTVPVEVGAEALRLLGNDAIRRSQYKTAREYYERCLESCKALGRDKDVVQALIALGDAAYGAENLLDCHRYLDDALQLWVAINRVQAADDWEGAIPTLKFMAPGAWDRREVEFSRTPEESAEDMDGDAIPKRWDESATDRVLLYFIPVDVATGNQATNAIEAWPVEVDGFVARIWLDFAHVALLEEQYDHAASCARLAGMIFTDLEHSAGALEALTVLESTGATALDHELVRFTEEARHTITIDAARGGDRDAVFLGLTYEAGSLVNKGDLGAARTKWNEALILATELRSDLQRASSLRGLAEIEQLEGNIGKAREHSDSAMELYRRRDNQEGLASLLMNRALLERSERQFDPAKKYVDAANAVYKRLGSVLGEFDALQELARNSCGQGRYEDAFAFHRAAESIAHSHKKPSLAAIVLSSIAALELLLGRGTDAEANYDEAVRIARRCKNSALESTILRDRASTLQEMAEYEKANRIIDRLLEMNERDAPAWDLKGWCCQQMGADKAMEAVAAHERSIAIAPHQIYTHKNLADALGLCGRREEAETKWRWVIDEFGRDVSPIDLPAIGWCHYKLGDFATAATIYHETTRRSSDTESEHFDLALMDAAVGHLDEAMRTYELAASILNGRLPPMRRLGLLDVAMRDLEEILERIPSLRGKAEIERVRDLLVQARVAAVSFD